MLAKLLDAQNAGMRPKIKLINISEIGFSAKLF
jgi:hypothetical protein